MAGRIADLPCAAFLVACAAPAATGVVSPVTGEAPRQVDAVADEYFAAWVQSFPLSALFSGVPDTPNEGLSDNSLAAVRAWEKREDRWLDRLKQVPAEAVRGRPEEATYGVLLETLEAARQTRVCRAELWPLDQQGGWQITLPLVSQLQPLGTERLRAEALTRWRAIPRYIDTEIGNLREGLRAGLHPAAGERPGGPDAARRHPGAPARRTRRSRGWPLATPRPASETRWSPSWRDRSSPPSAATATSSRPSTSPGPGRRRR